MSTPTQETIKQTVKTHKIDVGCDNYTRYTPGTRGGPGGRDQTPAVKRRKNAQKSAFFSTFYGRRLVTAAWATRSPWSINI